MSELPTRLQMIEVEYLIALGAAKECDSCDELDAVMAPLGGKDPQLVADLRLSLYDVGRRHLDRSHDYARKIMEAAR